MVSPNLMVPRQLEPFLRVGTYPWKYDAWQGLLDPTGTKDAPGIYLAEYARHLRMGPGAGLDRPWRRAPR